MNNQCILVHYHEIGLKGDNRSWFEDKLLHNIRIQLNDLPYQKIKIAAARIFIIGIDPEYYDKYNDCLKNVMGIKHAFIMSIIDLNNDAIGEAVQIQIQDLAFDSFSRKDRTYALIACLYFFSPTCTNASPIILYAFETIADISVPSSSNTAALVLLFRLASVTSRLQ